ncbi:hypothetical protein B0T19DRAFT_465232 [Cercophora scortea]|uniref:Uncharacterized protein n=1 Tax=Cercophora scortea TaxID=314031 RepID=A0AAE0I8C1_9PEZI|nr:hypothetical protein B0T19DRAFT_465232 [Cercophora scortea]
MAIAFSESVGGVFAQLCFYLIFGGIGCCIAYRAIQRRHAVVRRIYVTQRLLHLPENPCILGDVDPGLPDQHTALIIIYSAINSFFFWLASLCVYSSGISHGGSIFLLALVSFFVLVEWVTFIAFKNRRLKEQLPAVGGGMYYQGLFVTEKQEEGQEPQNLEVDMSKVEIDPSMFACF